MAKSSLRCAVVLALCFMARPSYAVIQYTLTILGSANPTGGPHQMDISSTGIVAYASNGKTFLYQNSVTTQVAALNSLNVAQLQLSDSGHFALLSSLQGYFYSGVGSPINVGSLQPGQNTVANAVNNSNVVVGYARDSNANAYRAFTWSGGTMTVLPGPGAGGVIPSFIDSNAYDINNNGQIAGSYSSQAPGGQAVIWTNNIPALLPIAAGYARSEAYAINASGQAAGYSADSGVNNARATIWTNGVALALPTPTNFNYDLAFGINDQGDVVGTGTTILNGSPFSALIWKGGQVFDLNTLIAPSAMHLDRAYAIDNAGDIVGYGHIGSQTSVFLLTAPEPASLTVLAGGVGILAVRGRRRK